MEIRLIHSKYGLWEWSKSPICRSRCHVTWCHVIMKQTWTWYKPVPTMKTNIIHFAATEMTLKVRSYEIISLKLVNQRNSNCDCDCETTMKIQFEHMQQLHCNSKITNWKIVFSGVFIPNDNDKRCSTPQQ